MADEDRLCDDVTPKQEKAIVALLTQHNIRRAADEAGVTEKTIYRWLSDPSFSRAYRRARREAFGQAIGLLQHYFALAVNTLAQVLMKKDASDTVKVQAANSVLKFARESIELDDLAARVESLESAQDEKSSTWD